MFGEESGGVNINYLDCLTFKSVRFKYLIAALEYNIQLQNRNKYSALF